MTDYFGFNRRRGNSDADRLHAPQPPGGRHVRPTGSFQSLRAPSNISIRRLPSSNQVPVARPGSQLGEEGVAEQDAAVSNRRRSFSDPQRYVGDLAPPDNRLSQVRTADQPHMRTITEGLEVPQPSRVAPQPSSESMYYEASEGPRPLTPSINLPSPVTELPPADRVATGAPVMADAANAARRNRGLRRFRTNTGMPESVPRRDHPREHNRNEYQADVVDLLDLIDPEVRTLGTLTNVQNSLFVPDLGGFFNRRPTYELSSRKSDIESRPRSRAGTRASQRPPSSRMPTIQQDPSSPSIEMQDQTLRRKTSITSQLSDSHFAVLPHGVDLEGWSKEDTDDLNDHVRHLLHSRKEGFKRSMRGFRQYISKPLGLFVTVYAILVTLFGAAWVFCLIGWIYIGNEQEYFINVIDLVLVAFFALIGDGMAPFRAVDTYHMCFIAHYHHLTWRLRQEKKLPDLVDHNDLPDRRVGREELEDVVDKEETAEFSVLSPLQQRRLQYHQAKFSKAHTFYKPHETATHHAFPLRLMVAAVVLLDCHSLLQVALGTCTWSIDYHVRPQALTATILSCSITCNIMAGVMISIGDHRSRKKDVLERMFRQELTEEAIQHIQQTRRSEWEERGLPADGNDDAVATALDKKASVRSGNNRAAAARLDSDKETSVGPGLTRPRTYSGT